MTQLKLEIGRQYATALNERLQLEAIRPLQGGDIQLELLVISGAKAGQKVLRAGSSHGLRAVRNQRPICTCTAYRFPHHRGLGKCQQKP